MSSRPASDPSAGLSLPSIVLVDDSHDVLEAFVEPLMIATGLQASFILHATQTAAQLVKEILKLQPAVVLLDQNMRGGVRGTALVPLLKKKQPGLIVIGFSTASSAKEEFTEAGADGFVEKDAGRPWDSLKAVADVLEGREL